MSTATQPKPTTTPKYDSTMHDRAKSLPKGLGEHVDTLCCCPPVPDAQLEDRALMAVRLERLTGGAMHVSYSPGASYLDEPESLGGLFGGFVNDQEKLDDTLSLDLRKGQLAKQLVAELERIGRAYQRLAGKVDAAIRGGKVHKSLTTARDRKSVA